MLQLEGRFLGAVQVVREGQTLTGFESDKVRALLVYLLVEGDRPHRREALAALLWPEQPEVTARQNLRQALYQLRQTLGDTAAPGVEPFLLVTRETVQRNPAAASGCDVSQARAALAAVAAHAHTPPDLCPTCLDRLHEAAALYRGEFLAGFTLADSAPFDEWLLPERENLHAQLLRAVDRLAGYYEALGQDEQALNCTRRLLLLEPWREGAHRQAMYLLARTGQRGAALAQYETCRQVLASELGLAPDRETTALYARIRAGTVAPEPLPGAPPLPIPPTTFVGREVEVTAIGELLRRPATRLLTVTGPGGVGKTRVALEAATALAPHFRDGVRFVNLAPIRASCNGAKTRTVRRASGCWKRSRSMPVNGWPPPARPRR